MKKELIVNLRTAIISIQQKKGLDSPLLKDLKVQLFLEQYFPVQFSFGHQGDIEWDEHSQTCWVRNHRDHSITLDQVQALINLGNSNTPQPKNEIKAKVPEKETKRRRVGFHLLIKNLPPAIEQIKKNKYFKIGNRLQNYQSFISQYSPDKKLCWSNDMQTCWWGPSENPAKISNWEAETLISKGEIAKEFAQYHSTCEKLEQAARYLLDPKHSSKDDKDLAEARNCLLNHYYIPNQDYDEFLRNTTFSGVTIQEHDFFKKSWIPNFIIHFGQSAKSYDKDGAEKIIAQYEAIKAAEDQLISSLVKNNGQVLHQAIHDINENYFDISNATTQLFIAQFSDEMKLCWDEDCRTFWWGPNNQNPAKITLREAESLIKQGEAAKELAQHRSTCKKLTEAMQYRLDPIRLKDNDEFFRDKTFSRVTIQKSETYPYFHPRFFVHTVQNDKLLNWKSEFSVTAVNAIIDRYEAVKLDTANQNNDHKDYKEEEFQPGMLEDKAKETEKEKHNHHNSTEDLDSQNNNPEVENDDQEKEPLLNDNQSEKSVQEDKAATYSETQQKQEDPQLEVMDDRLPQETTPADPPSPTPKYLEEKLRPATAIDRSEELLAADFEKAQQLIEKNKNAQEAELQKLEQSRETDSSSNQALEIKIQLAPSENDSKKEEQKETEKEKHTHHNSAEDLDSQNNKPGVENGDQEKEPLLKVKNNQSEKSVQEDEEKKIMHPDPGCFQNFISFVQLHQLLICLTAASGGVGYEELAPAFLEKFSAQLPSEFLIAAGILVPMASAIFVGTVLHWGASEIAPDRTPAPALKALLEVAMVSVPVALALVPYLMENSDLKALGEPGLYALLIMIPAMVGALIASVYNRYTSSSSAPAGMFKPITGKDKTTNCGSSVLDALFPLRNGR